MIETIDTHNSVIPAGKILILSMNDEQDVVLSRFLVLKDFDYRHYLEEVRRLGCYRTEDVKIRLKNELIKRELISELKEVELNLGDVGRPSSAMMDVYRQKLNESVTLADHVVKFLEAQHFEVQGPEGYLQIVKTGPGYTLGQVDIYITVNNIHKHVVLDVVGPPGADFPFDITKMVEKKIILSISQQFQQIENIDMAVFVNRSDIAKAEDALLYQ